MKQYLDYCFRSEEKLKAIRLDNLWVDSNLKPLSTMKLRKIFQKTIFLSDLNAFHRQTNIHSIRAVVASTLEMRGLSLLDISAKMNWKTHSTT